MEPQSLDSLLIFTPETPPPQRAKPKATQRQQAKETLPTAHAAGKSHIPEARTQTCSGPYHPGVARGSHGTHEAGRSEGRDDEAAATR